MLTEPPADNQHPVLTMVGDVDMATETEWRQRADDLLHAHPDLRYLTVDMGQVEFLDSRGMAVLVHLHASALNRGGTLSLRSVPPRVARALSVAGLDQVFQLEAS